MKAKINNIEIQQNTNDVVYIKFGNHVVYLDTSIESEFIVDVWSEVPAKREIVITKCDEQE